MKLITIAQGIRRRRLRTRGRAAAILAARFAGECPADKAGINVRAPVDTPAKGVTDTTLGAI